MIHCELRWNAIGTINILFLIFAIMNYKTKEEAELALAEMKEATKKRYELSGEKFIDNSFVTCTKTCISPKTMVPEWTIRMAICDQSMIDILNEWTKDSEEFWKIADREK